ncbi:hypothetical protein FisN_36Hh024 [Fistulifera solaris]|uniref:Uncharacterized protein n=1 Tax=Fistulifera solaris TaxID=1519565 RepID=A0A1Z5KT62_FISSO|nr:hypothetical protein FisN_36Hh024 [Fistulifera solaris]|eukprot:GAX29530.1 hypothetical protein FisN_36Hh024 [Fistulifera solaris]
MTVLLQPSRPASSGEISTYMTVILFFVTHGIVNSLLLAFSPIRCIYWKRAECNPDEAWMLNWLAFGMFHVNVLIACLAQKARGHVILEQRLVFLVTALILSYLSTGVFLLDHINKAIAGVQLAFYMVLLVVIIQHQSTAPFQVPLPAQLRSSSFDFRKQFPIATVAVGLQCVLSLFQVWDMTFGNGRYYYLGDLSGSIFNSISHAAVTQMLWVTLILGFSVLLATPEQQKSLLKGEAFSLFITLVLLSGEQGSKMDLTQTRAACVGTFFSMLIALFGSA